MRHFGEDGRVADLAAAVAPRSYADQGRRLLRGEERSAGVALARSATAFGHAGADHGRQDRVGAAVGGVARRIRHHLDADFAQLVGRHTAHLGVQTTKTNWVMS